MSSCKLDHSVEDVIGKLTDQKPFLPEELYNGSRQFLEQQQEQLALNELFHLLKKYDLASIEVREERNEGIRQLIANA